MKNYGKKYLLPSNLGLDLTQLVLSRPLLGVDLLHLLLSLTLHGGNLLLSLLLVGSDLLLLDTSVLPGQVVGVERTSSFANVLMVPDVAVLRVRF